MKNALEGIPASVRQGIFAVTPLLIVIILFLSVGKFGLSKISEIRTEISAGNNSVATLTQKLNVLKTLSATAAEGSILAATALPDTNSSLIIMSQLKSLAATQGVTISGVKSATGPLNPSGLGEVDVTFTVDGPRGNVFAMLAATANISPILILDKVKISESAGSVRADAMVRSYWAPLPKEIPAVNKPITDLTESERKILTSIQSLTQPVFTNVAPSEVFGFNTTPFGE